jgi:hypothetical protein
MRGLREERGVAALLTVGFLAVVGGIVIAFMLASARVNDSYTLLYSAAQSAAFSAATSAEIREGEVSIPCTSPLADVRGTPSRCEEGLAVESAYQVLKAIFASRPGGFCLYGYNCQSGGRAVYMRVDGATDTSLQVFNTDFNPGQGTKCYDQVLGPIGDIDALPIPSGQDGVIDRLESGKFLCWGLREDLGRPEPTMHSIQYSSGVVVRLETKVDLFAFRDQATVVSASAAVGQGE